MSVRHLGALVFAVSLAVPSAFAIDSGKAEGTITINRKPVKVKYAFAKKEKDMDEKDRYVVLLTDRAVSRSVLADSMRLSEAVKNGQVVVAMLTFDEAKTLAQSELKSKALQHGGMPLGSDLKMTGLAV